jgi:hypothetical protein
LNLSPEETSVDSGLLIEDKNLAFGVNSPLCEKVIFVNCSVLLILQLKETLVNKTEQLCAEGDEMVNNLNDGSRQLDARSVIGVVCFVFMCSCQAPNSIYLIFEALLRYFN